MTKKIINAGGPVTVPISPAVEVGDFVFVSGQVPVDIRTGQLVKGDIRIQTKTVLERIKTILEASGCSMKDVVKATVFLSRAEDFGAMNEVYRQFFPKDPPARSCVQAKLMIDADIEIETIAYKPNK